MDFALLWKKTLAQLEIRLNDESSFRRYFKFSKLIKIEDSVATIGTCGSFISQIIQTRYKPLVLEILSQNYGKKISLKFEVDDEMLKLSQTDRNEVVVDNDDVPLLNSAIGIDESVMHRLEKAGINPKYSFASFVLGDSNRFAHAAAFSVINNPNVRLNPLFIYGKTGLGKTHLAQAVGRAMIEKDISKRVLYVPSETFLNDLVGSIRTTKTTEFRKKYREIDCLIIDDIQMISRWVETQSEFFNTFNALNLANKQVILISDRPPEEIEKLEERIRSRFQGGISALVIEPELETRFAILLQKQKELNTSLSHQTLRDISRLVSSNVRELEGSLMKINLMQSLKPGVEISYIEIETLLGKTVTATKRKSVKPQDVIKDVSEFYNFKVSEIKGNVRTANLALARQVCMYILSKEFGIKLEEIARLLNKRDHTTVLHAKNKIEQKLKNEPLFAREIEKIVTKILEV